MSQEEKIVLDLNGVIELTTLSQSTIYARVKKGEFPKQIRIGPNRVVWRRAEVVAWVERELSKAAA